MAHHARKTGDTLLKIRDLRIEEKTEDMLALPDGARRIASVAGSAAASFDPAHPWIDQIAESPVSQSVMPRAQAEQDAVAPVLRMLRPRSEDAGIRYTHQVPAGQLPRAMTATATGPDVTTQVSVPSAIRDIVDRLNTAPPYIARDLADEPLPVIFDEATSALGQLLADGFPGLPDLVLSENGMKGVMA